MFEVMEYTLQNVMELDVALELEYYTWSSDYTPLGSNDERVSLCQPVVFVKRTLPGDGRTGSP